MGGLLLGITALYVSGLGLWIIFSEHEVRTYTYVHPSHFLDDLKFVADVIGPPVVVRNEQRGVSPEAPRASSLHVVR